ncbi:MAG: radical SAM protein [Candidatus Zixiibacteriota bacterium]
MLNGVHFLLTYACTYECDHCFLHCSPNAGGTFTIYQLRNVFDEIKKIKSIDNVYFEGGEPFLYYPLMLEGMRQAYHQGLKIGIVSNAYWANSVEDAQIWLREISKLRLSDLSLSDDSFHYSGTDISPAKLALTAARRLGLPSGTITIEKPCVKPGEENGQGEGKPVIGGNVLFKGRAAEKLTEGLPRRSWTELTSCPHEDLLAPERVHVDCFGHVHICQGLSMGNMWVTPLSVLVKNYNADDHPICGPLVKGGPAELARQYELEHEDSYVDECHFCYEMRKTLLDRFPEHLAPRQVYGLNA